MPLRNILSAIFIVLTLLSCNQKDKTANPFWVDYSAESIKEINPFVKDIFGVEISDSLLIQFNIPSNIHNPIVKNHQFSFAQGFYEAYRKGEVDSTTFYSSDYPTGYSDEQYNWQLFTLEGQMDSTLVLILDSDFDKDFNNEKLLQCGRANSNRLATFQY